MKLVSGVFLMFIFVVSLWKPAILFNYQYEFSLEIQQKEVKVEKDDPKESLSPSHSDNLPILYTHPESSGHLSARYPTPHVTIATPPPDASAL